MIDCKKIDEKIGQHKKDLQIVVENLGRLEQQQQQFVAKKFALMGAIESLTALKAEPEAAETPNEAKVKADEKKTVAAA